MDKIACVILNYNSPNITSNLAREIAGYKSVDYVVVVDNHSKDNSKTILSDLTEYNGKIKVMLEDENWGYAKGNNLGAQYAIDILKCDYVVIVNPDVTFKENYIIEVSKLLKSDPQIVVASAIAYDIEGKESYCCYWKLPTYIDYVRKFFSPHERKHQQQLLIKQKEIKDSYIITEVVSGACFMARKNVFMQLGGFDENTFLYCEESILGGKIKNAGYKEAITYKAVYNHNHQYKTEDAEHKVNHYKIMLDSRKYYLREIVCCNKLQMSIYNILSAISLGIRRIIWNIR